MSEHFTLDELAELDLGLLPRRRAAEASKHLDECEECTARADALRKTQEALGNLGPAQMPADVVARLDRALSEAGSTSGTDVVPDLGEHRARRVRRVSPWAYAAAAAVVVIGGTGIVLGTQHHGNSSAGTSANAPLVVTSVAPSELVQVATGRTYTPDSISDYANSLLGGSAAADSATAPQVGAAPGTATGGGGSAGGATRSSGPRQFATSSKAPAPSEALSAPAPASAKSASIPASLRRLADSRATLLKCAAYITDTPNASPLAVDFGRWTNAAAGIHHVPSVIFVFADTDDPTTVDVFVVGAACDAGSLLDFQVLPKTS